MLSWADRSAGYVDALPDAVVDDVVAQIAALRE